MTQWSSRHHNAISALLLVNTVQRLVPDASDLVSSKGLRLVSGVLNDAILIADEGDSPGEVCLPFRVGGDKLLRRTAENRPIPNSVSTGVALRGEGRSQQEEPGCP